MMDFLDFVAFEESYNSGGSSSGGSRGGEGGVQLRHHHVAILTSVGAYLLQLFFCFYSH